MEHLQRGASVRHDGRLDTDALRELNGLVALAGDTPAEAAEEWLGRQGLGSMTTQVAS